MYTRISASEKDLPVLRFYDFEQLDYNAEILGKVFQVGSSPFEMRV